jgi:hypothetical protein
MKTMQPAREGRSLKPLVPEAKENPNQNLSPSCGQKGIIEYFRMHDRANAKP